MAWQGNGMGAAWARHAMCKLAIGVLFCLICVLFYTCVFVAGLRTDTCALEPARSYTRIPTEWNRITTSKGNANLEC